MIEKHIVVDMCINTCPTVFTIQQDEKESRKLIISFTARGVPFPISGYTRVLLQIIKPNGQSILEDNDGDYLDIVNETVELIFSDQMTAVSGRAMAKLMFFDRESMVASTTFAFNVERTLIDEEKITSTDVYSALINALIRVEDGGQKALEQTIEYASGASTSEEHSKESETNAKQSEDNALQSATYAKLSEDNAKLSEESASNSATLATDKATESESYTHGGTGIRENEDTDNSKYYYDEIIKISELIHGAANPMTGATETEDGRVGLVPKPLIADKDKFLKGDGTWADISLFGVDNINGSAEINSYPGDIVITSFDKNIIPLLLSNLQSINTNGVWEAVSGTSSTYVINGITITVNHNNDIISCIDVIGTASSEVNTDFYLGDISLKANTTYYVSGCPSGGSYDSGYSLCIGEDTYDIGEGINITTAEEITKSTYLHIVSSTSIENSISFYPQIDISSHNFVPYKYTVTANNKTIALTGDTVVPIFGLKTTSDTTVISASANCNITVMTVKNDLGSQLTDIIATHNHNDKYSKLGHNHDDRYYTKEQTRPVVVSDTAPEDTRAIWIS